MRNLKQKVIRGIRWTSVNTVVISILQFVQLAILGRILEPKVFGLMAMLMVVLEFSRVFADMGLTHAIIQRKNPQKNELSTLYWFNLAVGIFLFLILYLLSPLFAIGFGVYELKHMFRLIILIFIISPFGVQFQTLLQKKLRFEVITKIDIVAKVFSMVVAISIAVAGFGL